MAAGGFSSRREALGKLCCSCEHGGQRGTEAASRRGVGELGLSGEAAVRRARNDKREALELWWF